ncbi:protein VACUOLELESS GAMETOPHYTES-like [Aristolochia californica]|uniref:protein VACUOLELESS GAMETOPHYTES-like n=1 Tax=Aristolochia californica TaxID=171875 RepID=UPI0035DE0BDE
MGSPRLKKAKTFFSKRSPSLMTTSETLLQPRKGEEIIHASHPQHPLAQVYSPYLFTCMGCKEYGAGRRFKCLRCDYDLHDFCALAPPSVQRHPLHSKHPIVFSTKPGGGFLRSACGVCGKTTKGFAYRCTTCSFEMHPCCAKLDQEMDVPSHEHALILHPESTFSNGDSGFICAVCGRKRVGQVYHCSLCDYHLHAVCAKDMVNGLYLNGIRAPEKKNKFGAAARIATQAFGGFIDGLIEGIGEAFGEVLIDSIAKGKR